MRPGRAFRSAGALAAALAGLAACASPRHAPAPAVLSSASPGAVLAAETWDFGPHRGLLLRTRSHRIFTTETDPFILERLPLFLDRALEHYTTALGPLPPPPLALEMYLMATREQWVRLTRDVMGEESAVYLRIQRGGFSAAGRALLWSIGRHDTLAIAAHEGWHQYTQRTFPDALPIWLEEGIAAYMEGYIEDPSQPARPIFMGWANPERHDQLRRAARNGELLGLQRLLDLSPQHLIDTAGDGVLTYYAQVWALVHYLAEAQDGKHRRALHTLLSDAAAGRLQTALALQLGQGPARTALSDRRGGSVFAAYFEADMERAASDYAAFVERLVADGSRAAIAAGRSPL